MSIRSQLARWQAAGLIDAATAQRIEAHEAGQRRPVALYVLGTLGAATVALGIVSVIASNWDAIPDWVKLAADLVLAAGLAAGTYVSATRALRWPTEVLVTLLYGFTLASLALVGQIYQLDTPDYQALCAWSAVTLPLVLLGRSAYLAVLVLAGLVTTHAVAASALFDHLTSLRSLDGTSVRDDVSATVLYGSPMLYVVLSRIPWLVRERPRFAAVTGMLGWVAIAGGGFALQFIWYDSVRSTELKVALATTLALSAALAFALPRLYPAVPARARAGLAVALGFAWLTLALGASFERPELDYVGALLQIAWLGLLAWTVLQLGRLYLFNLLAAALAVRVLVVYFEVFHSLLSTGMGLITGGMLTLLMAWLWRRKTRDVAKRMASAPEGAPDAA